MQKLIGLVISACILFSSCKAQSGADSLLNFMQVYKKDVSLSLRINDTLAAAKNGQKVMPLASTVKIIVAIEFARQASENLIDIGEQVALQELDRYYLKGTDGGAHESWLTYEINKKHVYKDSISLLDVARGMILFSSNANTEYLMDLLGLDNIQKSITQLGIKKHTPIYPIVAALFLYQNPRKLDEKKLLKSIKDLSNEAYSRYAYDIHKALKFSDSLKPKFRLSDLSMSMQQVWSSRLPASTTADYAQLASLLNKRQYLSAEGFQVLSKVLEAIMETAANKKLFKHAGMKGGSTAFVLTKCLYATTQNGTTIELAYFFDNLNFADNIRLQKWMNDFELNILTDAAFRQKVRAAFLATQ